MLDNKLKSKNKLEQKIKSKNKLEQHSKSKLEFNSKNKLELDYNLSFELYLKKPYKYYGKNKGKIGEGTYSNVYLLKKKDSSKVYVAKSFLGDEIEFCFIREISIMQSLKHPNIIKPIDVYYKYINNNSDNPQCKSGYIMKCANITLDEKIKRNYKITKKGLSYKHIKLYMYQLLLAIEYIHSKNIWHRDIKSNNILLFDDNLKLADFGIAKYELIYNNNNTSMLNMTENVVTLWYRAPELLFNLPYDDKIDIWAAGIIFCEMIKGEYMFVTSDYSEQSELLNNIDENTLAESEMIKQIFNFFGIPNQKEWPELYQSKKWYDNLKQYADYQFSDFKSHIKNKNIYDLLNKMLKVNPNKRISAKDALKHPLFDDITELNTSNNINNSIEIKKTNSSLNIFENKLINYIPDIDNVLNKFSLLNINIDIKKILQTYKLIATKLIQFRLSFLEFKTNCKIKSDLYNKSNLGEDYYNKSILSSNKYLFTSLIIYKMFIVKLISKYDKDLPITLNDLINKCELYFSAIFYITTKLYDTTNISRDHILEYLRIQYLYDANLIQDTMVKILFILDFNTMYSTIYHFYIFYINIYQKYIHRYLYKNDILDFPTEEFMNKLYNYCFYIMYLIELYDITFELNPQYASIAIINFTISLIFKSFSNTNNFKFQDDFKFLKGKDIENNSKIIIEWFQKNKFEIIQYLEKWSEFDSQIKSVINLI